MVVRSPLVCFCSPLKMGAFVGSLFGVCLKLELAVFAYPKLDFH